MAVPATPAPAWIVLPEYQRKTVVYPLRQLLEPPFTRVERAILQIDERSHVQRLLVTQAALVAHRHVGPDESGQFLDVAESRASVKGVQAPYGGNRALTFAFCAMANSTHPLVDGLPARRIGIGTRVGQGRHAPALGRTADDFAFGKIADVRRDRQNLGRLFRRHDAVEAVQKTVADAHADAVADPVFCAPLRIHPRDVQRKTIRLGPASQMTTRATQRAACISAGVLAGFHHDVVAEDDIGFVVVEHCTCFQFVDRRTSERR